MTSKRQKTREETERVREIRDRYTPKPVIFSARQAVSDIDYLLERSDKFRDAGEVITAFVEGMAEAIRKGASIETVAQRCELMATAARSAFGVGPGRAA